MSKIPSLVAGAGCYRPSPLPGPGGLGQLVNKVRSAEVANTQANQLGRIQQGVQNGTISQEEANKLLTKQAEIADTIKLAQADGFVSAGEQLQIKLQQFQAEFGIHEAKSGFEFESLFRDEGVAQTQGQQLGRLAEGIRSGELSSSEASTLLKGQADIAQGAAEAQSDGWTDPFESLGTALEQAKASLDIHREKNDFEKAPHGRLHFPILHF